ncbi:hypothetical protein [Paractinoplanes maris]|uniref:hypothetical protein n=1 Tax=Paractinoplanes maris TaxID=1734446 RepID=UPI0020213CCB|nr:hypothetical protein [Actinoplanes maris]
MSLEAAGKPPDTLASSRFFRTGYLPTYAGALFLIMLVWAGAPFERVHFDEAWKTAKSLTVIEALLLALGIVLIAVILQPLQAGLVRVLEGEYPSWLGSGLARRFHRWRRALLADRAESRLKAAVGAPGHDQLIQEAGVAAQRLRSRYPAEYNVRPTTLGNVLAATTETAGAAYGLDAVVAWPRLYPLLPDPFRAIVDDLRDSLDASARLCAVTALTAVATAVLVLPRSGWWALLAAAPAALAALSYIGAVRAATAYGAAVRSALDVHRFALVKALHLPLPTDHQTERLLNQQISDLLRQGVPLLRPYVHE